MKLPRVPSLGASFSDDIVLAPAPGDPHPGTLRAPTAFGDDIPAGRRVAVRVRLTADADGAPVFDFRDSDPPPAQGPSFRVTPRQVEAATMAAIARVLEIAPDAYRVPFSIEVDPDSWVGAAAPDPDPAVVVFGMARVLDAAYGAMANAWPSRAGSGSTLVGAIVRLTRDGASWAEQLRGGEGARPDRAGEHAPTGQHAPDRPAWCEVADSRREGSGGIGARNGGDGIERRYTVREACTAWVGIDRITNPPHGIDRAGPPHPAELWIEAPDGASRRVAAWTDHALEANSTLVVRTAGGAGHGFPGWGVDWDPDEFDAGSRRGDD